MVSDLLALDNLALNALSAHICNNPYSQIDKPQGEYVHKSGILVDSSLVELPEQKRLHGMGHSVQICGPSPLALASIPESTGRS